MSNVGIYKITSPTNKVYIGQSWDTENRLRQYRAGDMRKQRKLNNSIKKHGWTSHKFEVLMNVSENITQQMFDQIEQAYIDFYRNSGHELMNIREAGSRGKHSPETIELIRQSQIGKYVPPEVGRKISEAKKNPSVETLERMAESQRQLWADPEYREKMVLAHKGKPLSEEHKASLKRVARRGKAHHNFGKPLSKESIDKMKATKKAKGYKWSDETREKMKNRPPVSQERRQKLSEAMFGSNNYKAKTVIQLTMDGDFIKEWDCISDAERELGTPNSNIVKCLKGKRKSAGGYKWEYKNKNN